MKKRYSLVIALIVMFALILLALVFYNNYYGKASSSLGEARVCFNDSLKSCFSVEIAASALEKTRGLMFRTELDEDKGMLFVYDDIADRGFWMKNTLIPLDMIGIDENSSVVSINEGFQPCKIEICPIAIIKNSKYVLEVNSGIAKENNLSVGQKVEIIFN